MIAAALPRPRRVGWPVTPDTLLRWHQRRIARHWAQPNRPPGRPSTAPALRRLVLRIASENPTWGYRRIHGELLGLGHTIAASTIWQILNNANILPAPTRPKVTWSEFLRSQAAVACDSATVDTALLRRFYLLFFIDVGSRTVYFGGITQHPEGAWTTQAARNLFSPPRRRARWDACARARPRQPIHSSIRRDFQNRRLQGPQDTHPDAGRERVRRTLDRHPAYDHHGPVSGTHSSPAVMGATTGCPHDPTRSSPRCRGWRSPQGCPSASAKPCCGCQELGRGR